MADVALETSRPVLSIATSQLEAQLAQALDEMTERARGELAREGIAEGQMVFEGLIDARYQGQSHELTVPFAAAGSASEAFHQVHARTYGHAMRHRPVEIVNLRLQATGLIEKPDLAPEPVVQGDGQAALLGRRTVIGARGACQADLYERDRLAPGAAFPGPALVVQLDSTLYLPSGWRAQVDGYRNLILEQVAHQQRESG
jgi:N-methylhydantoinase A